MSRASSRTLLPLDTFAKIMGMHPLHFNGVEVQELAPATTCGSPIMQYAWQTANGVAREDIANAIADAEARIAQYTRFKLLPVFEADERHQYPRGHSPEQFGSWWNAHGQPSAVKTNFGHLIAGGVEARTPITLGVSVAYIDTDGDGYAETASVTTATTVTDPNEIALFYPGESADPSWEIRPINVTIAGGAVTVRARREQFVNPGILEGLGGRAVDGLDDSKFLLTVDVYRVWHDPSQQVQYLWESTPSGCGCGSVSCQACFLSAQFGCTVVRDYRTGLLSTVSATWNSATQAFESSSLAINRTPDRVRLWYRAGYRDQNGLPTRRPFVEMDPRWARAVAYFATALLTRPMCQCENVTSAVSHWQNDLAKQISTQSVSENFRLDAGLLRNPFGTSRGAIYAWRVFRNESIGEAVQL